MGHTRLSATSLKNPFDLTEVTIEPNGSIGLNACERRTLLKGLGGTLALPFLESDAFAKKTPDKEPLRFLVVGNPFGMHPGNFFPMDFGKDYQSSPTLKSSTGSAIDSPSFLTRITTWSAAMAVNFEGSAHRRAVV